jgi:hypothetical protein
MSAGVNFAGRSSLLVYGQGQLQMTGAGRQRVSFLPLSDGLAFLIETLRQIEARSCQLLKISPA